MLTQATHSENKHCPSLLANKRVMIVGLGKTGLSCVRFMQERGVNFAVADTRLQPPGLKVMQEQYPDVPLFLGEFNPSIFTDVDALIVSPGVSIQTPVIDACAKRGVEVIGDIELFAQCIEAPVLAITGSNGKSTVTSLLGEMVRRAGYSVGVGANLGKPALELIEDDPQVYVLELSSFQLETTFSLRTVTSTVLNLSEDHMDRYTCMDDYAAAKARIFRVTDIAVVNADDPIVEVMARGFSTTQVVYRFTLSEPSGDNEFGVIEKNGQEWLAHGKQSLLPISDMKIKGRHNTANALAALAMGTAFNLPREPMLEALRYFPGLPHRSQWILESQGVTWYNDSKGTNVGAALAAIAGIPAQKLIVILGGLGKGQDFSPLRTPLLQRARHVLLVGQDAPRIAEAITDAVPYSYVSDLDEAIKKAKSIAQPGDAVLLSPACASFDMFDGYEHRGNVFMQRVRALLQ